MTSLLKCDRHPREGPGALKRARKGKFLALNDKEIEKMLGLLAAVLIVLWLLGFFAFHVTSSFIHIVLVVGLILLVLHFVRGSASA
jgi:Family of unknown function (DUF5670)